MFELRKSFHFEASHVLAHHGGKCARLHGHSYVLTLVLRGSSLQHGGPQTNMLADFCDITAAAKPLLASHLDHHHLNDTLKTQSPTAEFIARWIYDALSSELPALYAVELRETASAVVTYRPSRKRKAALVTSFHAPSTHAVDSAVVVATPDSDDSSGSSDDTDGGGDCARNKYCASGVANGNCIGNGYTPAISSVPTSRSSSLPVPR
jgi:6-pyruvoyltetrahydropterin/6-carboxytetrahydropterin synthase